MSFIDQYRTQIVQTMQKYGVEKAFAFGSAVKDTMDLDSDVDLIIKFRDELDFVSYSDNYFALANELEQILDKPVDLITERTIKNPYLLENINSHKVTLI